MTLYPLPELITLEHFNGKEAEYKKVLHTIYSNEMFPEVSVIHLFGVPVYPQNRPDIYDMNGTLWHLMSHDPTHSKQEISRTIDIERCERLRWIPHVLHEAGNIHNKSIVCWDEQTRTKKGKKLSTHVYLHKERYLISLRKSSNYFALVTAFMVQEYMHPKYMKKSKDLLDPRLSL